MTNNDKATLLPCPFCGGEAETSYRDTSMDPLWCVFCTKCGCRTPEVSRGRDENDIWNTRTEVQPSPEGKPKLGKIDWVKCPICGEGDMRKSFDEDASYIHCVNSACGSNGGDNFDGLQSTTLEIPADNKATLVCFNNMNAGRQFCHDYPVHAATIRRALQSPSARVLQLETALRKAIRGTELWLDQIHGKLGSPNDGMRQESEKTIIAPMKEALSQSEDK